MHLDDVLTELVEHSGDRLLRVAYQLTHDAAAAQDLGRRLLIGCHPAIGNGGLQATSASSVVPVVRQLLKPA